MKTLAPTPPGTSQDPGHAFLAGRLGFRSRVRCLSFPGSGSRNARPTNQPGSGINNLVRGLTLTTSLNMKAASICAIGKAIGCRRGTRTGCAHTVKTTTISRRACTRWPSYDWLAFTVAIHSSADLAACSTVSCAACVPATNRPASPSAGPTGRPFSIGKPKCWAVSSGGLGE